MQSTFPPEPQEIIIDFLNISDEDIRTEILATSSANLSAAKCHALERLNIQPDPTLTPLQSYMKAMHELNGLPYTEPAHPRIVDTIMTTNANRFVWWLA